MDIRGQQYWMSQYGRKIHFQKSRCPKESEISENILLPDLVKQSESIEQQSGEIAERGMPT